MSCKYLQDFFCFVAKTIGALVFQTILMLKLFSSLFIALFFFTARTNAATYQIGPQREIKTLGAVVPNLKAGDVVEIDSGTYRETVTISAQGTREKPILIRGSGAARPIFDAENLNLSGVGAIPRGIIQIEGAFIVLEHLEFKNARNEQNAAGVRLLDSRWATIRDCVISRCDMGVFGGDRETALIENCEVFENGTEAHNGGSHNFYMHGNRVVVRGCYIHDSLWGQNYKSRAHYNELWWNLIKDSNEGEVGFVDANGHTDAPNSNVLMVGNTLISKAERTGNAAKFVLFGSELPAPDGVHNGTLFLFHNTFIAGNERVQFITLDDPQARLVAQQNMFVGSRNILRLARPAVEIRAQNNVLPSNAIVPEGWNAEIAAPQYVDGDGVTHDLQLTHSTVTDEAQIQR